jgi:hypothetical protein
MEQIAALALRLERTLRDARKRVGLDPRWTLCPTGGIGNVKAFVSLFGGNKLDILVLADNTKQDTKKIEEVRRGQVLKTGRVLTMSDFTGKSESDVEDLFEPELFTAIANAAYALPAANALTPTSLDAADTNTVRLVKKADAAFRVMPDGIPTYDHFTPADWLIRNPSALDDSKGGVKATLDRAEVLFKAVNAMLA